MIKAGRTLNVIDTFKNKTSYKNNLKINLVENSEIRSIKRNGLLNNNVNEEYLSW